MRLTHWQHGLASFLILLALLILVFFACIQPATSYYNERKEVLSKQQERLYKYQQITVQKDKLIPLYKRSLKTTNQHKYFLPKMTPSLAAAELQKKVKTLIAQQKGQLVSTQQIPTKADEVFTAVKIRVHMKSDLESLRTVLYELESSKPLTFVDNLQIQQVASSRRNNRLNNTPTIKPLDTRFELKVYMLNTMTQQAEIKQTVENPNVK